jgi:hypothetical protein
MLASRADTGEVPHVRLRKGQAASPRGVLRFADELIARIECAGSSGVKLLRADSAFWNKQLLARLQAAGWQYSISVRLQLWVKDQVRLIPESDWMTLEDYSEEDQARAHFPSARHTPQRRPATRPATPRRSPLHKTTPKRFRGTATRAAPTPNTHERVHRSLKATHRPPIRPHNAMPAPAVGAGGRADCGRAHHGRR